MIIAIDGPAGVGKSTVSRLCAKIVGFQYLNSGEIYRAVTKLHLDSRSDPEDKEALLESARSATIALTNDRVIANGADITASLHTDEVDRWVAQHSAVVPVRRIVVNIIRRVTADMNAIVEGRDISTVVFPDSELKVYLDASVVVRAERRYKQGTSNKSVEELRENIEMRDAIDTNKPEGSLKRASDAYYIDTSCLTIEEVCAKVSGLIRNTISKKSC